MKQWIDPQGFGIVYFRDDNKYLIINLNQEDDPKSDDYTVFQLDNSNPECVPGPVVSIVDRSPYITVMMNRWGGWE